jgi:RsiW-degrading membrane proteinase PrsW (M82 family)
VSFEPILLAPEKEEKEIVPYRRIWRSAVTEVVILLALTAGMLLFTRLYKGSLDDTQRRLIGITLSLTPLVLWGFISYAGERQAPQPRARILTVVILTGLAANAIGIPLVDRYFAVDQWLATASGISRIVGYTLTVGIAQEFLKYLVMRYTVWPNNFRTRSDGVAYAMAAGIGYATVLNLNYVFSNAADPSGVALRVAEYTLSQLAISVIMGYYLAESKLNRNTSLLWLPAALMFGALLTGLFVAVRGGLIVGSVSTASTASNGIQGLGAAVILVVVLFYSFYFLINNADERTQLRSRPEYFQ